jgi:choline dehydrogenase
MFDYIVVGGGSAGCAVAARLSEESSVRVLLLEAGGADRHPFIHVPAAFSRLFKTAVDWQLSTEPQEHLKQRRLYWPRGKVLGGSSSINAMIYVRGHRHDYDDWQALGNDSWSFADVLPYFKKCENHERGASEYHGVGGPLNVAELTAPNPLSRAFLEACAQVGLSLNDDFNGPHQEGVGFNPVNQKAGRRVSAAGAYLRPARGRGNLTVVTGAHATRVLMEGNRAVGVEYVRRGRLQQARTGGEVVLCGGAVHSPHLLLLSGIGPKNDLELLNIPVAVDLPGVGRNLQDHVIHGVSYACTKPVALDRAATVWNLLRAWFWGKGPLTSNIAEAGGFVRSEAELERPDLQLYFAPVSFIEHGFVRPPGYGFSLGVCLLRPRSRGEITLRSRDPLQPPCVQPRYLEDAADVTPLIEGLRLARRIVRASAFDPFRGTERLPGSHVIAEEELVADLRARLETLYHPAGTCKMGKDGLAVVNPRLQVHGTRGLRVVDASIMPTLIGGNTNAPVLMIAEKAVDLMLERSPPRRETVARIAADNLPG